VEQPTASGGAGHGPSGELPYIPCGNRREYRDWFKAQVVRECLAPGSSVSIVARRYDVNANVVFRWRKEWRAGILQKRLRSPDGFADVGVVGAAGSLAMPMTKLVTPVLPSPKNAESKKAATAVARRTVETSRRINRRVGAAVRAQDAYRRRCRQGRASAASGHGARLRMITLKPGTRVHLYCRAIDLRRGFNGLVALIVNHLNADPFSGHLYIFRGKRGQRATFYIQFTVRQDFVPLAPFV
jgi:transposase-like protein